MLRIPRILLRIFFYLFALSFYVHMYICCIAKEKQTKTVYKRLFLQQNDKKKKKI
jgi:hypothetical protein